MTLKLKELMIVANALDKPSGAPDDIPVLVLKRDAAIGIAIDLSDGYIQSINPVSPADILDKMLNGVVMVCGCQIKRVGP